MMDLRGHGWIGHLMCSLTCHGSVVVGHLAKVVFPLPHPSQLGLLGHLLNPFPQKNPLGGRSTQAEWKTGCHTSEPPLIGFLQPPRHQKWGAYANTQQYPD